MKRPLTLALLAALAASAHAHFLWATLDPAKKTVSVGLQETPSEAPLPLAGRAKVVRVEGVSLAAEGNWLRGPAPRDVVGASLDYGVLDRSADGRGKFWLKYYAKAAATVEASRKSVGLPVEISLRRITDGIMIAKVAQNGKPVEGAEVTIEVSTGDKGLDNGGKTDALGEIQMQQSSGPFAIRVLVTENVKGPGYDLIRSYSTLNIGVSPKPFSRVLHDSFGDNHDVVSHSGFIETVMAEKLTKAQLVDHLRQREIVNTELDRILGGASAVPYGPKQKEVKTLLQADLTSLGAPMTTEAEAWPVTKAFLNEIRASEKQGPYFALGVFHVYYGGITNGGRDIGTMIGDQTKFTPTYYLKSDGYMDYLKALNALPLSEEAKAEAIHGGQSAYRYIIAVNDEAAFKAK